MHPKICGWLYTEHHDVINEWNGYYKFDRTQKFTGLEELVPGMTLNDFHSDIYIATEGDICKKAKINETVNVPLIASFMTGYNYGQNLTLKAELAGWDKLGRYSQYSSAKRSVEYKPWLCKEIANLPVLMPPTPGLAILRLTLEDPAGKVLHHNFISFVVGDDENSPVRSISLNEKKANLVTFSPSSFTSADWSQKQWNVLDGLKVNGAGYGFFEYKVTIPDYINIPDVSYVSLVLEASAKQLFGKDKPKSDKVDGDFMRGKGTFDNGLNPNSYPMTDETRFPSNVRIRVNGELIGTSVLEDDPADHRGILSWYSQPKNNMLNEAGSYGYLINMNVPYRLITESTGKTLTIRFEVDKTFPGGLAIYGEKFGRYPLDPTLVFVMK
jgi:hypothetical protein